MDHVTRAAKVAACRTELKRRQLSPSEQDDAAIAAYRPGRFGRADVFERSIRRRRRLHGIDRPRDTLRRLRADSDRRLYNAGDNFR